MKRLIGMTIVALAVLVTFKSTAKAEKREGIEVNRPSAAVNFTQSIDVSPYDRLSAQAVYSDGIPSTHSIVSGARASATITIGANPSALISSQAFVTINIVSTTTILGDAVTLNGTVFREGVNFSVGASSGATATNLSARIDAHPDFVSTVLGSSVTVRYVIYGTSGNGLPATTSDVTSMTVSSSVFSGGVPQNAISINGTTLTETVSFNANSSSATTASNVVVAINANTSLNTQVIASSSSATPGIVTVKAIAPGYSNYSLASSTTGFLTSGGFPGGLASDVDLANDIITKVSHRLTTGLPVLLVTVAGTAPTGLVTGTTYYAIKLNDDRYALATTSTTAVAGTKIDITAVTDSATTDVRPAALIIGQGNGFSWQASNDNVNFTSLSTVTYSTVTYSAAGNSIWDFGEFGYKYLRVNYVAPTQGSISLSVKIYGRKD